MVLVNGTGKPVPATRKGYPNPCHSLGGPAGFLTHEYASVRTMCNGGGVVHVVHDGGGVRDV